MYATYLRHALEPEGLPTLAEMMRNDGRLGLMAKMLSGKPSLVSELASVLFPETPANQAFQYLDDLATCATTAETSSGQPLLSLRFHFLLRALEGVRMGFEPEPQVYVTGGGGTVSTRTLFDMALCSHCGQHFIAGQVLGGWMMPAIQDPGHDGFKPVYYRPTLARAVGREDAARRLEACPNNEWFVLCASCAMVGVGALPPCDHDVLVLLEEVVATGKDSKVRCPSCDSARSTIRPVLHGTDGPHAVIATALFTGLEEDKRKILAFADSRQRAAFFAWYLQDSYESIMRRNLLYQGIRELARSSPEISAEDGADWYSSRLQGAGMLPESTTYGARSKIAQIAVFQEVLHEDKKVSLEGTGLIAGRIKLPAWAQLSQDAVAPWGIPLEQALEMEQWILETLVEDNAVEFGLTDAHIEWGQLGLASRRVEAVLGPRGGSDAVISIDSPRTRRVGLIAKVLAKWAGESPCNSSFEDKAISFIQLMIQTIIDGQAEVPAVDQVLFRAKQGYRVNLRWWRWHLPSETLMLRRCQSCNQLTFWNLADLCADFRCHGTLVPCTETDLEDHHYRRLYLEPLPGRMRAEEHTAQLDRVLALQFQREFKQGHIHVLSSSTTFELGVDLGDLNVIFLRNVPPESFNYVQRVGRAGRRPGLPGIAVTYCGRSPHDLYHFEDPLRMISGETRTPIIKLDNDVLVARHWVAAVLSVFFRDPENTGRFRKVEDFFGGSMDQPDIMESLSQFCIQRREEFHALFRRLVPPEAQDVLFESWEGVLIGPDSRLSLAVQETSGDWIRAKTVEQEASASGQYSTAEWAKRRGQEIAQQDVLSFLSRKVVIPKYGFPVDVVGLDLLSESREASSVTLQCDLALAISEFAPSAEVVANKRVWVSRALKTVTGKAWPKHTYRRCTTHNVFERAQSDGTYGSSPCCGQMQEAEYVIPIFGFSTTREPAKQPTRPIERLFSTRPFFSDPGGWGEAPLRIGGSSDVLPLIEAYNVRPGEIVVLSEGRQGRGFYICPLCGAADTKILKKHKAPWGSACSGKSLASQTLGQQFKTDILRVSFPRKSSDNTVLSAGLAYALQCGAAEYLEIPMNDLAALGTRMDPLSVVLYDNVPGGAGFVSQLTTEAALLTCIDRALERVSGRCGCNESSSCYGCLRSYNNQFLHHLLERGPIYDFLFRLRSGVQAA